VRKGHIPESSSASAQSLMAGVRRSQGKWDEALEYAEKALAMNPNDPRMMLGLSLVITILEDLTKTLH